MKLKFFFLIALSLVFILCTVNSMVVDRDLSGNFSAKEIRQVKLGMTLEQVEDILGYPYAIRSLAGLHNSHCTNPKSMLDEPVCGQTNIRQVVDKKFSETDFCCEGNKEDLSEKRVTLEFSKHVKSFGEYPMLWIHLDKNFRVYEVYAKSYDGYFGIDDPTIYSLNKDGLFENKEAFNKLFAGN